jgi:hemerythrin-like domain-containing protein
MTQTAPQELMAQSLLRIHTALRRSLDTIVRVAGAPVPEGERAGFADFCSRFTRFLHVHHDGEETIFFPKLSEAAARASQPAFVTGVSGWRADHEKLLGHLSAFEKATADFRTGGTGETLHRTASEVREVLFPHLQSEESALDAGLARLLQPDEVAALESAAAEHGQRVGGPAVLVLLAHALTADEQQAQFGAMPWFVRKVLLKRIWARSFRGSLKYAHNTSIAL